MSTNSPLGKANPALVLEATSHLYWLGDIHPDERRTITAVLPNMHDEDIVRRIMALSPAHVSLLANVLRAGLQVARRGVSSTPHASFPTASASAPSGGLSGSKAKSTGPAESTSPYASLAAALGLAEFASFGSTSPEADSLPFETDKQKLEYRENKQRRLCLDRQLDECPISRHAPAAAQCCHLLPHSTAALATYDSSVFWFFLTLVFGTTARDRLWEMAGGNKSFSPTNSIVLDASLHALFEEGYFLLVPAHETRTVGDGGKGAYYDVKLRWMCEFAVLDKMSVKKPKLPQDQVRFGSDGSYEYLSGEPRSYSDRDCFRICTYDRKRLPLPSAALLRLRCALWQMIAEVGLWRSSSSAGRKRKAPPPRRTSSKKRRKSGGDSANSVLASHRTRSGIAQGRELFPADAAGDTDADDSSDDDDDTPWIHRADSSPPDPFFLAPILRHQTRSCTSPYPPPFSSDEDDASSVDTDASSSTFAADF